MKVYRDLAEITAPLEGVVATVGNFDGVHLGHRSIFRQVKKSAAASGGVSVVITFVPHPLKVLAPERSIRLINTYAEKETLIEASGIDYLVAIPFSHEFSLLSPEEFVSRILVEIIGVKRLIIGYDYAFGRGREGDTATLQRLGEKFGFPVEVLAPIGSDGIIFSSSRIRQMIESGDVRGVIPLLGRHFSIGGTVIHGTHSGTDLGFPTANLASDKELIPAYGVYAVKVKIDGQVYNGACNIGNNPTFNGKETTIEVFVFDFAGNLYGSEVRLYFVDRLREERKFADAELLKKAISADVTRCREILHDVSIIEYREYLNEELP